MFIIYLIPKDTLDEIVSLNIIDGIECAHRKHTEEEITFLIDYCNSHKLEKSGGIDFYIDSHYLGYANKGNYATDDDLLKEWSCEEIMIFLVLILSINYRIKSLQIIKKH